MLLEYEFPDVFRRQSKGIRNNEMLMRQTSLKADLQEKENVLSKKEAENNALREQIRKLMQE